jgi:hypothetical protein
MDWPASSEARSSLEITPPGSRDLRLVSLRRYGVWRVLHISGSCLGPRHPPLSRPWRSPYRRHVRSSAIRQSRVDHEEIFPVFCPYLGKAPSVCHEHAAIGKRSRDHRGIKGGIIDSQSAPSPLRQPARLLTARKSSPRSKGSNRLSPCCSIKSRTCAIAHNGLPTLLPRLLDRRRFPAGDIGDEAIDIRRLQIGDSAVAKQWEQPNRRTRRY